MTWPCVTKSCFEGETAGENGRRRMENWFLILVTRTSRVGHLQGTGGAYLISDSSHAHFNWNSSYSIHSQHVVISLGKKHRGLWGSLSLKTKLIWWACVDERHSTYVQHKKEKAPFVSKIQFALIPYSTTLPENAPDEFLSHLLLAFPSPFPWMVALEHKLGFFPLLKTKTRYSFSLSAQSFCQVL